jgi:ceramide glucosyltransferase
VLLCWILGGLALLTVFIGGWQFVAALRFPLHRRVPPAVPAPGVTLLKSLKGCDAHTRDCLRSWFTQDHAGPVQLLFAVQDASDPVCAIVRDLAAEFPAADVRLEVVPHLVGANAKVSKLAHLENFIAHDRVVISDADVKVPADLLAQILAPLQDPKVGLVNCFYRLANPTTAAMRWEAVAINADFWSQVLQSRTLKAQDFALGAAMAVPKARLADIGGLRGLADHLADDYQLGNRIARLGYRIELCPVVVECWDAPMGWGKVWAHQLRWARTIRVCQPAPFAASILSDQTVWVTAFALALGRPWGPWVFAAGFALRAATAVVLQARIGIPATGSRVGAVFLKDLLGLAIWAAAFFGDQVVWRGVAYRVGRDGKLTRL